MTALSLHNIVCKLAETNCFIPVRCYLPADQVPSDDRFPQPVVNTGTRAFPDGTWRGSFLLLIQVKPEVKGIEPQSSGDIFLDPDKNAVETLMLHYSPTISPMDARQPSWRYGRRPKRCQQWRRRVRTGVWRQDDTCREFPRVRECDGSQFSTWQCDGDAYADHDLHTSSSPLCLSSRGDDCRCSGSGLSDCHLHLN